MKNQSKTKREKAWALIDGKGEIWTFRAQAAICPLPEQAVRLKEMMLAIDNYTVKMVECTITYNIKEK